MYVNFDYSITKHMAQTLGQFVAFKVRVGWYACDIILKGRFSDEISQGGKFYPKTVGPHLWMTPLITLTS